MPDRNKNDLNIEIIVGLFVFLILIALSVFTIVLSRQNFLQKKYPIQVVFEEIGGLREGDHVFLRGMQVGVVKSTHLENDHVIVRTDLEVPIEFREGYKVEVVAASMLGGKALKIYEGSLQAAPISSSDVIRGEIPIDILEELGVAVVGLREMAQNLESGEGTLGKLIQDETMYNEMKGMMENLNEISGRLANGEGALGKFLSKDNALYEDVQGTMASLREVTSKMASGEGTIGRLLQSDEVYLEAQELLAELRAAIDDMRETSPVTTFSAIFFGAF